MYIKSEWNTFALSYSGSYQHQFNSADSIQQLGNKHSAPSGTAPGESATGFPSRTV